MEPTLLQTAKLLNAEAQQMIAEINRTATETNFNGQKLLDWFFHKHNFRLVRMRVKLLL